MPHTAPPSIPFLPNMILLGMILMLASLSACDANTPSETTDTPAPPTPAAQDVTLVAGCNSCHGEDGVGNNPEVPFIAGQDANYLESAMRGYLIGDRQHEVMRAAVFDIDALERQQLAEHYAQLDAPWTAKTGAAPAASGQPRDLRAGQALSRPCAGCHGRDGNSIIEGVPSLAGLQPAYFIPALKSYLQGERQGAAIMKNFKLSLSEADIRQLAAFFAAQKRQRSPLGRQLKASDASDELAHRCLGCHGEDGNSTHPAMPSLAGQNAGYLIKAMQTYRDRERQNRMMTDIAQGLSDEAIQRNAVYFATRTPRAVGVAQASQTGTENFDPLGDGEKLAASCNACHGERGNSKTPGTPRLAGLSEDYLQTAIAHYRNGDRQHAMMQMLTRYLGDTDIEKLALYYASQTPMPPAPVAQAAQPDSTVTELAAGCAGCHGEDGNSQDSAIPSLAGQDARYIAAALAAYRNDQRQHSDMKNAAQALDKSASQKLGVYYSRLAPKNSPVHIMEAPAVLSQKCDRCHGEGGGNPDADKPRIAGQRQAYLVKALNGYKNKDRLNSTMNKMTAELSQLEIEAIAAHYSRQ
ncbi:MAG: c-type cytochrome [Gammaproteobacteria bacterium]|nr:c-type cytochrome [Gammaproteobacteria bacterium]